MMVPRLLAKFNEFVGLMKGRREIGTQAPFQASWLAEMDVVGNRPGATAFTVAR